MARIYLAKVPVHSLLRRDDVRKSPVSWDINSPTFRHRAVMGLFGDLPGRAEAKILFRLDHVAGQAPFFLVQSEAVPAIPEAVTGAEVRELELPALAPGQPLSLRIAANAVRRTTVNEGGKRKTRVAAIPFDGDPDHTGVEGASENTETVSSWLARKLAPALNDLEIVNHIREVLQDPPAAGGSKALQIDTIDAIGSVGDPRALEALVRDGVGREKAYGCGLLSVRGLK